MISSRPKDGEAIVEQRNGEFVATRILLAFFDDLASAIAGDPSGMISEQVAAAVSNLLLYADAELSVAEAIINMALVQCGNNAHEIELIKSRLEQVESACL